jgi:hypothetical protein
MVGMMEMVGMDEMGSIDGRGKIDIVTGDADLILFYSVGGVRVSVSFLGPKVEGGLIVYQ